MQSFGPDLVKDILGQTSGFMPRDIRALIADAGSFFASRCSISRFSYKDGKDTGNQIFADIKSDLEKALERSKKRNASALGTPKVRALPHVFDLIQILYFESNSFLDLGRFIVGHCDIIRS